MRASPSLAAWLPTFCASMILMLGTATQADMSLDRSILVFDAGSQPRQDVEITNSSAENLYLETEILLVSQPGTEQETREQILDPDAIDLLVTPARLIVPPGARRLLRVVHLGEPPEVDRIYRVNVRPVVGPVEADATAVKVIVAYQLLIIVRPPNPQPDLGWSREGRQIAFQNRGNSNILLFNGVQCPPDGGDCIELNTARRLYAGNDWTLELPFDAAVEFTTGIGQRNVRQRFD
ncbi:MAG: fimbria/pilus periplasmic chaperone [Gammaproteobacteria bacterium]|nr:fimbria/pilus periplasmic chaperone [Gammaproteobacteria bacterium]